MPTARRRGPRLLLLLPTIIAALAPCTGRRARRLWPCPPAGAPGAASPSPTRSWRPGRSPTTSFAWKGRGSVLTDHPSRLTHEEQSLIRVLARSHRREGRGPPGPDLESAP